jgi:predicted DNA-binding transcriptional regulator YafY
VNRMDRALGILLLLRGGDSVNASDLARRFEVSTRTIYRDVDALAQIGVPVFAERGREGGFRLVEGYFLPPVMFTRSEAVSLLLAATMLRSLRSRPFAAELETAEEKLLAAVPTNLRHVLAEARRVVGTEAAPTDPFHPEMSAESTSPAHSSATESRTVSTFLQAVLDRRAVALTYRSPYRAHSERLQVAPLGVFWDRDRWYLAGTSIDRPADGPPRLWRADRVLEIRETGTPVEANHTFDVRGMLGRRWLCAAMQAWAEESPVRLHITPEQHERLQTDWYYRHARYEPQPGGPILMTFGESNPRIVFDLLRWLGPGAQLLEPHEWRAALREELQAILSAYEDTPRG